MNETGTGGYTTEEAYANYSGFDSSVGASIVSTYTGPAGLPAPEGGASADLTYYIYYSGPAGMNLPVVVTATGANASSTTAASEIESLTLTDLGVRLEAGSTGGLPTSFSGTEVMIPADTLEEVVLHAGAGLSTPLGGTVSAYVDPTFTIDPSFAQASEYTLEFSPVPEPASLPLMGLGVAALLCVRHFRGRTAA